MNAMNVASAVQRAQHVGKAVAAGVVLCLALASGASADVIHDESIDGDLSNDQFNPTEITLSLGINSLLATSVSGDREYVAITIPVGMQLAQLRLISYVGEDDTAFIGVQEGPVMTEPPMGANPANLLGWSHFGPGAGNVGQNILPDIGMGPEAIGFVPPLDAGVYTFWIQQTGTNAATYQFNFVVIPAPATAALLALGALAPRRRRHPL